MLHSDIFCTIISKVVGGVGSIADQVICWADGGQLQELWQIVEEGVANDWHHEMAGTILVPEKDSDFF